VITRDVTNFGSYRDPSGTEFLLFCFFDFDIDAGMVRWYSMVVWCGGMVEVFVFFSIFFWLGILSALVS
jgi:hypothetical protein